jgi:hypothetical protein
VIVRRGRDVLGVESLNLADAKGRRNLLASLRGITPGEAEALGAALVRLAAKVGTDWKNCQDKLARQTHAAEEKQLVDAGTVAAGITFDLVVIAQDSFGNSVTSYTGTAAFSSTEHDPAVMLPAQYTFTAGDNGTHTFSGGATLFTPGQKTMTVTDDGGLSATLTVTI